MKRVLLYLLITTTTMVLGQVITNETVSQTLSLPLPEDIEIIAPSSDTPEKIAAFSGRWEGVWDFRLHLILVVERVDSERATVIYAWGDLPRWNIKKGYSRFPGKAVFGKEARIEFGGEGREFVFTMKNDLETIRGICRFKGYINRITMHKTK